MQFEQRELKPYAQPVSASNLTLGSTYFSVIYVDDEMLIPTVEPLIFIGENLDVNDIGRVVYFQDAQSYRRGLRHDSAENDPDITLFAGQKTKYNTSLEYEDAVDELLRCSLRRRKATRG
jgi:hypothetical protein